MIQFGLIDSLEIESFIGCQIKRNFSGHFCLQIESNSDYFWRNNHF